jgi:hypothetical protein
MFSIALRHAEHTRKYNVVTSQASGWDLTLTEDLKPTRQVHYDDWHRVERALATLQLEVRELTAKGWHVDPENRSHPPALQS